MSANMEKVATGPKSFEVDINALSSLACTYGIDPGGRVSSSSQPANDPLPVDLQFRLTKTI